MGFRIEKKQNDEIFITLTRGDTFYTTITINNHTLSSTDVVTFGMKKEYSDTECAVTKIIPNDTLKLELTPNDTKELDWGLYVFSIKLVADDGTTDTFIQGKIKLIEEVV